MHPVDAHVGYRIRETRLQHDLKMDDLAKLLKLSSQQLQKYETGVNRVSASRLFELSIIFNVPVSYFFEGLDRSSLPVLDRLDVKQPNSVELNDEIPRLQKAFRRITKPKLRQKVLELIETMAADKQGVGEKHLTDSSD